MRESSVWQRAFGLARTVVEDVSFDDEAEAVVIAVRPVARARVGATAAGAGRLAMTGGPCRTGSEWSHRLCGVRIALSQNAS